MCIYLIYVVWRKKVLKCMRFVLYTFKNLIKISCRKGNVFFSMKSAEIKVIN